VSKLLLFTKYHGAGNDFIVIDDRSKKFPSHNPEVIIRLCSRRFGIGADGLILLHSSEEADFQMVYFNADGKEAALCGNGLRCLAHFLSKHVSPVGSWTIETLDRIVACSMEGSQISVSMGPYQRLERDLVLEGRHVQVIHTGVPHAVIMSSSLDIPDFEEEARKIRFHPRFGSEGVNVNFAMQTSQGAWECRTYERGVEKETLACGTGAAAVAIAALKEPSKNQISVKTASQETLSVTVDQGNVVVSGPATFVFAGTISI